MNNVQSEARERLSNYAKKQATEVSLTCNYSEVGISSYKCYLKQKHYPQHNYHSTRIYLVTNLQKTHTVADQQTSNNLLCWMS
jgi:hypothetical protein